MTTKQAARNELARIGDTRFVINQANGEYRARQLGVLTTRERILRLSSRFLQHQRAGRTQAAAATLRMAKRLMETAE